MLPLLSASALLFLAGRVGLGSGWFYAATLGSGLALLLGWRYCAPRTRLSLADAPVGLLAGLLLLLPSAVATVLMARIPLFAPLFEQVTGLLGESALHPWQAVALFLVVLLNATAEELFFREALPTRLSRYPAAISVLLYAAMTTVFGVVLLPVAAVVLATAMYLLRTRTGGITAPIVAHIVWTSGMIGVVAALG
ncbi:CPBP family intramembrane glutamic endopeptidase [Corynebacterium lowii]|uniref:CAAX amino terminal protease self-immunity n=1 Tax=Corynebacterium lowii TaxID=1544413 RepID=A0A0Q1E344_9CORY|nr:CPBP family intramembrane glutamic endopeptidase [Corynebacterium lowii]KQB87073.1 CAAX amino terminal protease self- immunity [Corynebacterium lowii]MDP9852343.1 membrane protease YdiL (CAAX protease family) [Corynebacterium lowii]